MAQAATKSVALWVVRRLRAAGFQALLAGGCVRDMLLGRRCTDYDVATDATPRQVRKLFRHVLLVGAKFGVAMVIHNRRRVEVATFRTDFSYSDGRRPDRVKFSSPREDALRRDFTINGMFFDPIAGEVIDYVGGRQDLAAKVVRTIGSAEQRFAEDYLRMIRAVRFAVRLGFTIDPATAEAVRRLGHNIVAISGERIFEELSKMLSVPTAAGALECMESLDLARHVLPEFFGMRGGSSKRHGSRFGGPCLGGGAGDARLALDAGPRRQGLANHVPRGLPGAGAACEGAWAAAKGRVAAVAARKELTLALAALLCDLPARDIRRMTRRWGASNDLCEALVWLAEHRDDWRAAPEMPLAEFRRLAGHAEWPHLRVLWQVRERVETHQARCARRVVTRLKEIPGGKALPPPLVRGADLLELGVPEGPRLGRLLREAYDAQLNLQVDGRAEALAWVRRRMEDG